MVSLVGERIVRGKYKVICVVRKTDNCVRFFSNILSSSGIAGWKSVAPRPLENMCDE